MEAPDVAIDLPLRGIRVLDLTRLLPGPAAGMHLADMGAEVIKIEDHGIGDYARTMGPMHNGTSLFYQAINRGKQSRLSLICYLPQKTLPIGLTSSALPIAASAQSCAWTKPCNIRTLSRDNCRRALLPAMDVRYGKSLQRLSSLHKLDKTIRLHAKMTCQRAQFHA
jgi:hypothetical protein